MRAEQGAGAGVGGGGARPARPTPAGVLGQLQELPHPPSEQPVPAQHPLSLTENYSWVCITNPQFVILFHKLNSNCEIVIQSVKL